jgi:hypothetical protein
MTAAVRVALVLLMVLGLAGRLQALGRTAPAINTAASLLAPLASLGLHTEGPDADGIVTAGAPGCAVPVQAAMLDLAGGEDPVGAALLGPGIRARYVYLGSVFDRNDRWVMYARRLKAEIAAMLGLRATGVPFRLVMVAIPDSCPSMAGLDWAALSPAD